MQNLNQTIVEFFDKAQLINKSVEQNSEIEYEIRFGKISKDRFNSVVSQQLFNNVYHFLNQPNVNKNESFTQETSCNVQDGSLRKIIKTDKTFSSAIEEKYILKQKKNTKDVENKNIDLRFALNIEKKLLKNDFEKLLQNNKENVFKRNKQRFSFIYEIGQFDLTIVNGQTFEIEFEIKVPVNIEELKYDRLNEILNVLNIISDIQGNINDINNTIYEYTSILKLQTLKFVGGQPITLQKDNLSQLYTELYSVTDKADGERYFMFINKNGNIYLMDSNIKNVFKTDLFCDSFKSCIIDGEFLEPSKSKNQKPSFYAFDILSYNGIDIRGKKEFLFKERFNKLEQVIKSIKKSGNFDVDIKQFYYKNVFLASRIILNTIENKPYDNDGLIFTPINEPYPISRQWKSLYKWKPNKLNSIDFYSVKQTNGSWLLYVQGPTYSQNKENKTNNLVLFDIQKICKESTETNITYETNIDANLIDPATNKPFESNTVIEYAWEKNNDSFKWIPLRSRPDKTANPKKHGNYVLVACDIWKSINNPVTKENIFNMTNQKTPNNNTKNNFFFEPAVRDKSNKKKNLNKKFNIIEDNNKDFSFLKSENDFQNYINNKENLTFMLINKPSLVIDYKIKDNEILYYLKITKENTNSIFGNTLDMYLIGITNENLLTNYYINPENFKSYLENIGYKCICNELIQNDLPITYTYFIFQKTDKIKLQIPKQYKIQKNINTSQAISQINKHITLYKINNSYDICNIINCLEYKIYNNTIQNQTINSLESLKNVINIINKETHLNYHIINEHNYQQIYQEKQLENFNICFYNHTYQVLNNNNTNNLEEEIYEDVNSSYIFLYNNKILIDKDNVFNIINTLKEIKQEITGKQEIKNEQEIINEQVIDKQVIDEKVITDEQDIKQIIKSKLNKKTTVKELKEYLKEFKLSVIGNRNELINRLDKYCSVV